MIHFIPTIDDASSIWAAAMFRAVWQGTIALSIAWLICGAMPRLSGRVRCWIWRAAYFKLLIALVWATPINLPLLRARPVAAPAVPLLVVHHAADAPPALVAEVSTPAVAARGIVDLPISAPVTAKSAVVAESPRISICAMLFSLWIVGVAIGCLQLAREWLGACRLRASADPICDAQLIERLAKFAARMNLRRLPSFLSSKDAHGPLLTGQLRPVVILPKTLLEECSMSRIEIAAAHELAHLRRHDLLWCWLARISRILFFFHPLVLLTQRDWHESQERACDESVVTLTGICPADYGATLLSIISICTFPRRRVLALGIADSRKSLERRLLAMKHFTSTLRHPWALGMLILCAIVVGLVPFRIIAQTPAQASVDGESGLAATRPSQEARNVATAQNDVPPKEPTAEELGGIDALISQMCRVAAEKRMRVEELESKSKNSPAAVSARKALEVSNAEIEARREELNAKYILRFDPGGRPIGLVPRYGPPNGVVQGVSVKLSSVMAGIIREINCQNGQKVMKGDLLVRLDDTEVQARLDIAKADMGQAEAEYVRERGLASDDFDAAIAKVQKAKALAKIAQYQASQARITAPIDGVVVRCSAVAGQTVQSGEELAVVVNSDALVVRADVPAASFTLAKVGQKVAVAWGQNQREQVEGVLTFISPQIDARSQDEGVEASVDNKDGRLRLGMQVTLKLIPAK